MLGLEPGIQAALSVVGPRASALDARVKPVHDDPPRAVEGTSAGGQGQIFFGFSPILKVFGSPLVNS
jgi:hypothetical protein